MIDPLPWASDSKKVETRLPSVQAAHLETAFLKAAGKLCYKTMSPVTALHPIFLQWGESRDCTTCCRIQQHQPTPGMLPTLYSLATPPANALQGLTIEANRVPYTSDCATCCKGEEHKRHHSAFPSIVKTLQFSET